MDIWQKLKTETKPILIYGTGNGADKLIDHLNAKSIKISGVFASDGFVRDRTFRGFKVLSLTKAKELFKDFIALISFGTGRTETLNYIKNLQKEITIFCAEVPVIGNEIFDLEFLNKYKKDLEYVYNNLYDEESKKTFYNIIMFKLTGELDYLFKCESDYKNDFKNILNLKQNSSYLDLGAYNGDTVLEFIKNVGGGGKITAVESDAKTFKKLLDNTKDFNVDCINAAVLNKDGTVLFSSKGNRGSFVGEGEEIKAITIDSLFKNANYDFIKFDIEGQELNAIIGGKNTITNNKPKMFVSCYHKNQDLFTIPKQVLKYNANYKILLRHYPAVPAWETAFYFI